MGSEFPLISVIMGVRYKSDDTALLKRSVDSILNQSYGNLELIICMKECSVPAQEFLQKISGEKARITLLDGSDRNHLGGQLNRCIEQSKGNFIARMDDDDFSYLNRFEVQMKFLGEHPQISFVGSNVRLVRDGEAVGRRNLPPFPQVKDFLFVQPFIHPSMIFRRDCLETVGGYSDAENRRGCEDYDLLLRLYKSGFLGANIEEILLDYALPPRGVKKRTMAIRANETRTRYARFKELGLLPRALPYVVKPIAVGMIPEILLDKIKKRNIRR